MSDAQDQYRKEFGLGEPPEPEKAEKALNLALDIRKFEIASAITQNRPVIIT